MNSNTQPEPFYSHWLYIGDDDRYPARGQVLISWARWQQQSEEAFHWRYSAYGRELGVRVPADVDSEALGARAREFDLIVVTVASFTDGRVFSLARELRQRHGYRRLLVAEGDILPDQVTALKRCGVDEVRLPDSRSHRVVAPFSAYYQRTGSSTVACGHVGSLRRRKRQAGGSGH
jgi:uncharacterized protein (DUF934 family)